MKRKCKLCDKTTNENLDDYHHIGWIAIKIVPGLSQVACPEHADELMDVILKETYGG